MKYINDLTYLSHIKQTEQLVKDKKQRNKYRQTGLFKRSGKADDDITDDDITDDDIINDGYTNNANDDNIDENTIANKSSHKASPDTREELDRREGYDRRQSKQDRGRYVESRQKKNRRHQKELRITI